MSHSHLSPLISLREGRTSQVHLAGFHAQKQPSTPKRSTEKAQADPSNIQRTPDILPNPPKNQNMEYPSLPPALPPEPRGTPSDTGPWRSTRQTTPVLPKITDRAAKANSLPTRPTGMILQAERKPVNVHHHIAVAVAQSHAAVFTVRCNALGHGGRRRGRRTRRRRGQCQRACR